MYNIKDKKDAIYLHQANLPKIPDFESQKLNSDQRPYSASTKTTSRESRSTTETFMDYLDSWRKSALNFDVSDTLMTAVDRVRDFPKDSLAFCVGIGQVAKLASEELVATSKDIGEIIEDRGYISGFKLVCRKGADEIIFYIKPVYAKVKEALTHVSKQILGDDMHEAFSTFLDKYVGSLARYAIDQFDKLLGSKEKENEAHENTYKPSSTFSSIDLAMNGSTDKDQTKEDFLGELISKAGDFLNNSKEFFAHNILDKDTNGVNPLTPEILIEGDLRSRPISEALPPAWVASEKQKAQHEINEYRNAFKESASVDIQTGEISNLAKLNLLSRSKVG